LQEKYGVKVNHSEKKAWMEIKGFKDLAAASVLPPSECEKFLKSMLNQLNSNFTKLLSDENIFKLPKVENSICKHQQDPQILANYSMDLLRHKKDYKRSCESLKTVKSDKSLSFWINAWFENKGLKFQRVDSIDSKVTKFILSMSYNDNDIMLYEMIWEVALNHIKVYTNMTNRRQDQWRIPDLSDQQTRALLSTLNIKTYFGKLHYDIDLETWSFVLTVSDLSAPFSEDLIGKLWSNLYKSTCKFNIEISNTLVLFNANPNLRPREIWDLAIGYLHQEKIVIQGEKEIGDLGMIKNSEKSLFSLLNVLSKDDYNFKLPSIKVQVEDMKQLEVLSKLDQRGYTFYKGKYLSLPCLFFEIDNYESKEYQIQIKIQTQAQNQIQCDSIPAIYGSSYAKISSVGNEFEIKGLNDRHALKYIIVQTYEGEMYVGDKAINFLKMVKPQHAKVIAYEYFSTLCHLYSKGWFFSSDIVIHYDKSVETELEIIKSNDELIAETNDNREEIDLFDVKVAPELNFSLFPWYFNKLDTLQMKFEFQNDKNEYYEIVTLSDAIESFIEHITEQAKNESQYNFSNANWNIFWGYANFLDMLSKLYFDLPLKYLFYRLMTVKSVEKGQEPVYWNWKFLSQRNFSNLEYLKQVFKTLGEFIRYGAFIKMMKEMNYQKLKQTPTLMKLKAAISQSGFMLDLFDKNICMDLMLEDLQARTVYCHNYSQDLF
jgi:hypothetical protein